MSSGSVVVPSTSRGTFTRDDVPPEGRLGSTVGGCEPSPVPDIVAEPVSVEVSVAPAELEVELTTGEGMAVAVTVDLVTVEVPSVAGATDPVVVEVAVVDVPVPVTPTPAPVAVAVAVVAVPVAVLTMVVPVAVATDAGDGLVWEVEIRVLSVVPTDPPEMGWLLFAAATFWGVSNVETLVVTVTEVSLILVAGSGLSARFS